MQRVVDSIVVAVGAKVDERSIQRGRSAMGGLAAAAGVAMAATAAYTIGTAAAMDETAKAARALDLTTEEYTRLTYAADRSGVSQEQLRTGLTALQARLAAVAAGSAEASKAFSDVGVSVRDSNGEMRTAADLLPEVADALAGMSSGDRLAAIPRLLGESGGAMATLIAEGSEGIDALGDRAEELGLVLGTQTAENAEQLTDSMTDLRGALSGLGMVVVEHVMPPLTVLVDQMTDFLTASDGIVQTALPRAARAIGSAFEFLTSPAGKMAGSILAVVGAIGAVSAGSGLMGGMSAAIPMLGTMASGMSGILGPAAAMGVAVIGVGLIIDDMIVTAKGGDSAIRRMADALGVGEETARTFAEAGEMLGSAWSAIPATMDAVGGALRQTGSALSPLLDMLGPLGDRIRSLFETIDLGGAITGIGDTFASAAEGYRELAGFMAGDPNVQVDSTSIDASNLGGVMGFIPEVAGTIIAGGAAASRRESVAQTLAAAREDTTVYVTVGSTMSPAEQARIVGRETEAQVRQAISAAEAL